MDRRQTNSPRIDPIRAVELIEMAEPERLGLLAGDVARLVLEEADRDTDGAVDDRSWAAVDATRGFASGGLDVDDLHRITREATDVAREPKARRVEPHVVAVAALAAEVAIAVATGMVEDATSLTREILVWSTRTPDQVDAVSDTLERHIAALEIFSDHSTG